jgi:hypothetical protein
MIARAALSEIAIRNLASRPAKAISFIKMLTRWLGLWANVIL